MIGRKISTLLLALGLVTTLTAQGRNRTHNSKMYNSPLQWGVTAGLNFGATPPLPIPCEVTKMYAWYPNINPAARIWGLYRLSESSPLSLSYGLEAERKSFSATTMLTELEIAFPGEEHKGSFTGNQNVTIDNAYLTLPVGLSYALAKGRLQLKLEAYASLLMSAKFVVKLDGDGTLNGTALAPESILQFNFGDQIRPYDLGLRFGAKYYVTRHWGVDLGLSYGITPATKRDFRQMFPHSLHNLYGFAGITYRLP